jgi:hypothetical protein
LSVLCKDLQEELYPYLEDILNAILPHLDSTHVQLLESAFSSITLVFKHLLDKIVQTPFALYKRLEKYVHHAKPFIRTFSCEAFAFVTRRLPLEKKRDLFEAILANGSMEKDLFSTGFANLVFEDVKVWSSASNHENSTFPMDFIPKCQKRFFCF